MESDYRIVKPRFSGFFGTPLDLILRRLGVDTVILAGTTTPNCIRTSCYDALSLDYDAIVLSDCTSSVTEEVQRANWRKPSPPPWRASARRSRRSRGSELFLDKSGSRSFN